MVYKEIEWKNYKGVLLPVTPQHQSIYLTEKEQKELLKRSGVHIIRWMNEWDTPKATNFWYIIKDHFGGFEEYSAKNRKHVRQGLKNFSVKKIDLDYLLKNGYIIYNKAYNYYKYFKKDRNIKKIPSKEEFISIYKKTAESSEFWGVFEKDTNKFVAFSEVTIRDNAVILGSMKLDPDYLKKYSAYALIHTRNEYYLKNQNYKYVSDGARSLLHETNIQEMLIRVFKFRKAYCKLNIAFSPLFKSIVIILYPFRKVIYVINQQLFKKISTILKMYEIAIKYGK